jgi:uncharacterized SAM-binding protein YcdF (DUF218 family)/glycosyltransferase involved in cell wall biosynthesis
MLKETYNIVCISTIDWDFVWQGHQEIMSTLAREGHHVLFIENTGVRSVTLKDLPRLRHRLLNWRRGIKGVRKVMDNVYVYAPLVLPFPYSRIARAINKALMIWTLRSWTKSMRFDSPIIWTWLPTALTLELIEVLDGRLVIYYCCDDFQVSSSGSRRIRKTEDVLLRKADLVFAHSKSLFDRCSQLTDQVHVFQYGFNRDVFARTGEQPPKDVASIPRPILGYVGGVHRHVDLDLLDAVAQAHLDKSLVLVGPLQMDVSRLAGRPNIHFLGQKKYEQLPIYIKHFDLGLIPYALNEYTRSVYPTKLNEYLIMGKPVISTNLPEVEYFNQCHHGVVSIAADRGDFVSRITSELADDNEARRAQRVQEVETNAWHEKIAAMEELIQAKLEEKAKQREVNWQQTLGKFYRSSRHRAAKLAVALVLLYGLLFYTPAIWWLGTPLRMADQPAPADVIVVLAGGIGESGEPGEAYQEKVQQAVELYRQAYAPTLIFSSGVGYVFEEAQVMKALAVSLGIPEGAIILEERGGGNYGSLLNIKRIMDSNGWHRMLLVTSRYNTVRSRLVVGKNLPDIDVRCTPAARSIFFGASDSVNWIQTRAILHEYGAIAYYWLKGYI